MRHEVGHHVVEQRARGQEQEHEAMTSGMNIIIFCCAGSAPAAGIIRCCQNCVTPISTGVM